MFEVYKNPKYIKLLLIPMLILSLVYLNKEKFIFKDAKQLKEKVIIKKFKQITQKDFYSKFQSYLKKYTIACSDEKFGKNSYSCEFISDYNTSLYFLHNVAQTFYIKEYKLDAVNEKYKVYLQLSQKIFEEDFNKFMKIDIQSIIPKEDQTAYAIFDNYIFINNCWYKIGDKYDGGILYAIKNKSFIIKKNNKFIEIKMFNE